MNASGSYQYIRNGTTYSISSSGRAYGVSTGGAALIYEDGSLNSIRQLTAVSIDALSDLYAVSGNKQYALDEGVQVLLRDTTGDRGYYATTLSEINASEYTLTGWYDNLGYSAGGRIRIIVATKN